MIKINEFTKKQEDDIMKLFINNAKGDWCNPVFRETMSHALIFNFRNNVDMFLKPSDNSNSKKDCSKCCNYVNKTCSYAKFYLKDNGKCSVYVKSSHS